MKLEDIREILSSSDASHWNTESPSRSGSKSVAVYRDDVRLRVEISYLQDGEENDDFREEWANNFPNPKAQSYLANLYYGSSFLKLYIVVSVDGGRALLPLPDSAASLVVQRDRYLIASLFDSAGTLDQYMARANLTLSS